MLFQSLSNSQSNTDTSHCDEVVATGVANALRITSAAKHATTESMQRHRKSVHFRVDAEDTAGLQYASRVADLVGERSPPSGLHLVVPSDLPAPLLHEFGQSVVGIPVRWLVTSSHMWSRQHALLLEHDLRVGVDVKAQSTQVLVCIVDSAFDSLEYLWAINVCVAVRDVRGRYGVLIVVEAPELVRGVLLAKRTAWSVCIVYLFLILLFGRSGCLHMRRAGRGRRCRRRRGFLSRLSEKAEAARDSVGGVVVVHTRAVSKVFR
jgi:hypothetical protein